MVKAKGMASDGSPLYLLGLSDLNIDRLREGKPILVNLRDIGGVGHVVICWGKTEEALAAELLATFTTDRIINLKNPNG